jgi:hypothetical protein
VAHHLLKWNPQNTLTNICQSGQGTTIYNQVECIEHAYMVILETPSALHYLTHKLLRPTKWFEISLRNNHREMKLEMVRTPMFALRKWD